MANTKLVKIEFKQTSNIFLNTGIIGLYRYLKEFQRKKADECDFTFGLNENSLVVECEEVLDLLEEVYYFMGKEIYDTSSSKQKEKNENAYYDEMTKQFYRFPRMKTYGLAALITNDPVPFMRNEEESSTMKKLSKSNPTLAENFKDYFQKNGLKLASKIYFNGSYIKTTRLKLEPKYWETGNKICPITNEGFKKLEKGINISPFFKGLVSFNSFLDTKDIQVSQKALLLLRFSPVLAMYSYYNGYDSFSASFFNSDSLKNINELYNTDFFYPNMVMESWKLPFKRNIKLENFTFTKKDDENYTIETLDDSYSPEEVTFLIIYTFYKRKLQERFSGTEDLDIDLLMELGIENIPLSLVTLKADKFASTLRPNFYEEYTNAKFIIYLIHLLETHTPKQVPIKEIWRGLVLQTAQSFAQSDFNKRKRLERGLRIQIISRLLKGKSVLRFMVSLFHKSFLTLVTNAEAGYRKYDILLEFLIIYESTLNIMDKEFQKSSLNLGKMIGQAIIRYENAQTPIEQRANAKNGRKYLISLNKARTKNQLLDSLIRLQNKYLISIPNEVANQVDDKNFISVKQYIQIGALNSINFILTKKNKNEN